MYKAYITILTNVRKHPNADRLLLADVFGNTVCVSTDYTECQLGVYFPPDGQLSVEFAEQNNLVRKKDDAGNNIGGYLEPDKRNIRAIRLRGEKSDGLFLPISALDYCFAHGDASIELRAGDVIEGVVNGHEICCKYIPRSNSSNRSHQSGGNRTRKHKAPTAPLFKEHADTEQLAYNLSAFKVGDEIEITLKMHGTSQRTGYLPVLQGYKDSWPCRVGNAFRHIMRKMGCYHGEDVHDGEPVYDYGYVSGTRRTVLDDYEGGYYGSNEFREQHSKTFEGKLWKGETVYYEVVGFTTNGTPIMGDADNKKLNDKEFIKQYGETTRFSYRCSPKPMPALVYGPTGEIRVEAVPQSDIYVYRMTMTNPDGEVVEYTPDSMRYRCEQMAVKTVPVFWKGIIEGKRIETGEISPGEWIKNIAEGFYDGPDPIGKTHVREGVVVRIINRPKFAAYKHKNWSFKCLSGIAIADAEASGATEGMSEDMLAEM
jgi:hypothetical protein